MLVLCAYAIGVRVQKTLTNNVEEGDTPKDLLDGRGKGLDRVPGLSSSETDELSAGEREGSGHEDRAETLESVSESTRVVPRLGALVCAVCAILGATAENEDESDNEEDANGDKLEQRGPKLLFSVTDSSEDVDDNDQDEEDSNPDGDGN